MFLKNAYHICFGASSEYINYAAPLIYSIVQNTKENGDKTPYCFHIFTQDLQEESKERYELLEVELNKIYPCKIALHTLDSYEFSEFSYPHWCPSPAMFYKLFAPQILSEVDVCLFMGVDMLCVGDLREVFKTPLGDNLVAAAQDCCNYDSFIRVAKAKDSSKPPLEFRESKYYINNDVMLLNLAAWRRENITQKCKYYLENYHLEGVLDVFPLACYPKIILLPQKWNLIAGVWTRECFRELCGLENTFRGESETPIWGFSREELKEYLSDLKIVHFCHYVYKPWMSPYNSHFVYKNMGLDDELKPIFYPYYKEWWEVALNTPAFEEVFKKLEFENLKNALNNYAEALSVRIAQKEHRINGEINALKNSVGQLAKSQAASKDRLDGVESRLDDLALRFHTSAVNRVKNHLAFRLGSVMVGNYKSVGGILKMPFSLLKIIREFNFEQKIYKAQARQNPLLKLPPLESCSDYAESLALKNSLKYKLGAALRPAKRRGFFGIPGVLGGGAIWLLFEIKRILKEHKNGK